MIENLNDEIKNIKIFEAKRRKIRDKFFNTQIYVNNILKWIILVIPDFFETLYLLF